MNNYKRISTLVMAVVLAGGVLAGCGEKSVPIGIDTNNPRIEVMTSANKMDSAPPESPVVQAMEKHLGEKMSEKYGKQYDKVSLAINWVISTAYGEKVTAALGASEYPHVMLVTARNSSIIQNSKHGTFWDLSSAFDAKDEKYVTDENPEGYVYPHLAKASKITNKNIAIDGMINGIYRARTIGRQGMTFRKDWLNNLGLDTPETIDDLDEMMRLFTEGDPDGNGQKDTYGMIITTYLDGPLNNLAIWMGSPNEWGYDEETDQWKPWFMSEGYFNALTKLREWYAAGYINQNMATFDANSWDQPFLNGEGGIQIDVADRARRNATNIADKNPKAIVDVIGYVKKDAESEPKTLPTTGYNGYYVVPKQMVETEAELDFVLSVLDECNGNEISNMCNYGLEGMHYIIDETGAAQKFTKDYLVATEGMSDDEATVKSDSLAKDYNDLNQFAMGVDPNVGIKAAYANEVAAKVDWVYKDNENWAVINPMAPYTSEMYSMSGTTLDGIIAEAKVNYIVGKWDEAQYKSKIEEWLKMDGELVMEDYKFAYEDDKGNYDDDGNLVIPEEYRFKFKF